MQLGSGDGDIVCRHSGTALRVLIRLGLLTRSALLVVDAGVLAGADIRAALRGVDATSGSQRAVDIHLCIHKIFFSAVIGLAGRVTNSFEFQAIGVTIAAPFILVIGIDGNTVGNHQFCAACDVGLNAGQKCCSLVYRQFAAIRKIDCHVIGDRQNIVLGTDRGACQLQIQIIDFGFTIDCINDAIRCAVIHFCHAAGDDFKHAGIPDKGDGGGIDSAAGINRRICSFCRSLFQCHCRLYVLDIVLIEWKDLIADTHCRGTATEVQNLIPLIDCTTGFHRDCTRTGDKAPSVQIAPACDRDITASIQPNLAIISGHTASGAAGSRLILTANAESTLQREGDPFGKGQ